MKHLIAKLLGSAPPDPRRLAQHYQPRFSPFSSLLNVNRHGVPLWTVAQRALQILRSNPVKPHSAPHPHLEPWWRPTPAVHLAALLLHVGVQKADTREHHDDGLPPHQLESASISRDIMRELGVPFAPRQHATALIRNFRRPADFSDSSTTDSAFRRLACRLDPASLLALYGADMASLPPDIIQKARRRSLRFRVRAEKLGVYRAPPAPRVSCMALEEMGYEGQALQRIIGALRYFQLCETDLDTDWYRKRAEQELEINPRGRLHLLIGIPASGKSRWASHHLGHTNIISSDRMREELTGDPSDQSQNYLVFQRCISRMRNLLHEGREVTFDATNYNENLRKDIVEAARWAGAEIYSYYFDISLNLALERNESRDRWVPRQIIHRHWRLLTQPALFEADQHHRVDPHGQCHLYWPNEVTRLSAGGS
ncbi:MAG: AAA family ATPase [Candidatus Brocadiia bacterium]